MTPFYTYIYIYHLDFYIEIGSNISRDWKYKAITCTGSIWAVKLHCLYTFLLYTVTNKIYCFLVPDSCWATIRNGNSISADVAESTIKTIITTLISALIDNLAVVLGFSHLILKLVQINYIFSHIVTYIVYLLSIWDFAKESVGFTIRPIANFLHSKMKERKSIFLSDSYGIKLELTNGKRPEKRADLRLSQIQLIFNMFL